RDSVTAPWLLPIYFTLWPAGNFHDRQAAVARPPHASVDSAAAAAGGVVHSPGRGVLGDRRELHALQSCLAVDGRVRVHATGDDRRAGGLARAASRRRAGRRGPYAFPDGAGPGAERAVQ